VSDQEKRAALAAEIKAKLESASANNVIDHDAVRTESPALAAVLDEFLMSKSYRTDPWSTSKQVAEILVARDPDSQLGQLIGSLNQELKNPKK
jgi:hypothetical protein